MTMYIIPKSSFARVKCFQDTLRTYFGTKDINGPAMRKGELCKNGFDNTILIKVLIIT